MSKPCPSVKFVVNHDDSYDVENSKCKIDETITNVKEIQLWNLKMKKAIRG